jgi:hypothetical protein
VWRENLYTTTPYTERREDAVKWTQYWRSNAYYLQERALLTERKAEELEEMAAALGGEPHPAGAGSVCDVADDVAESEEE